MKVIGTDGHKLSGLHVLGDLIGSLLLAVAQNLLVGWLGEMMEFLIVVENAVGVEDLRLVAGLVVDAMSSPNCRHAKRTLNSQILHTKHAHKITKFENNEIYNSMGDGMYCVG